VPGSAGVIRIREKAEETGINFEHACKFRKDDRWMKRKPLHGCTEEDTFQSLEMLLKMRI